MSASYVDNTIADAARATRWESASRAGGAGVAAREWVRNFSILANGTEGTGECVLWKERILLRQLAGTRGVWTAMHVHVDFLGLARSSDMA